MIRTERPTQAQRIPLHAFARRLDCSLRERLPYLGRHKTLQ